MKYSVLYILTIIFVISQIFGFPGLLLAVLLVMIISLLNTIELARRLEENAASANTKIGEISGRLDAISQQVGEIMAEGEKKVFALENRIDEVKTDYRLELESQYRDLAKKIIDVENRLIDIRKTIGAAFGSLEDRLENR